MPHPFVAAICGVIFTFGFTLLISHLVGRVTRDLPKLVVVGFEKLEGEYALVTLSDGRKFRGSCVVWHSWPTGKRAPTSVELLCSDEWTRRMWELG